MRRRVEEPDGLVPPAELTDYRRWCAGRGVPAYGDPRDAVSMRAAVARWEAWQDERAAWAATHSGVEPETVLGEIGAPWDESAI